MITETRMITLFQGDPKVFMDARGSRLEWIGGQSIMDAGWENAVFISLFTTLEPKNSPRGWAGNYLFEDQNVWIGSRYEAALAESITITSLNTARDEAQKALDWMLNTNLASEIIVDVTNPITDRIETLIRIRPPDLPVQELLLIKNGVNWIFQLKDPAAGRFSLGT